jgi:hypothetical protein
MAITADYSVVPYVPSRQIMSPHAPGYSNAPAVCEVRAAGVRDGWSEHPLSGRPAQFYRPKATYSSLRKIQTYRPAATGLVVDIFV